MQDDDHADNAEYKYYADLLGWEIADDGPD